MTAKQQRRRENERAFRTLRRKQGKIAGRQPLRDPGYLDFIRSLQCCVPGCTSVNLHQWTQAGAWTEAAHVGDRGLRQKCSDRETIPLCVRHHRTGKDSHHVMGKNFWAHHEIDRDAVIAGYNKLYEQEKAA